jgi:hypothetical protein
MNYIQKNNVGIIIMKLIDVVPTPAGSSKRMVASFCECAGGKTTCAEKDRKKIQFGSKGSSTYLDPETTDAKRDAYIKRHSVNEDFHKVGPAALSRWVLWSSRSIAGGIRNFKKNVKC